MQDMINEGREDNTK